MLLCIIATLAGARSARLVSLEAAAALTGRFFDRRSSGIVCAALLRHGLRSRSSASSLPSLVLGRLCSSRSRQQQLSPVASSIARSTGIACAALLRHGLRSRSSASSLPRWCSVGSARLARDNSSSHRSLLRSHIVEDDVVAMGVVTVVKAVVGEAGRSEVECGPGNGCRVNGRG